MSPEPLRSYTERSRTPFGDPQTLLRTIEYSNPPLAEQDDVHEPSMGIALNLELALQQMGLNEPLKQRLLELGWDNEQLQLLKDFEGNQAFALIFIEQIVANQDLELLEALDEERVADHIHFLETQRDEFEALSRVIFLESEVEPDTCPEGFDPSLFLSAETRQANRLSYFGSMRLVPTAELEAWLREKGWDSETIAELGSDTVDGFVDNLITQAFLRWDLALLQSMPQSCSDRIHIAIEGRRDRLDADLAFMNRYFEDPPE